ncbi:MAG: type II secretion system secretin GspD [Thiotrichales bacterium]|nr:type II secretion system secretin GspD [Thiotrichales bacterium]
MPVMAQESTEQSPQGFGNFQNADIEKVIEAVAKITGHNFVIDPRVKGKVTLIAPEGMHPDDLYQTLLSILNVHGFVAVDAQGLTKIVPANMAKDQLNYRDFRETGQDWVTEVLNVRHVEATKLVAILRPLVAREGHLVGLAESNRLIITDTVANIQRIKAVIRKVDINQFDEFEVVAVEHAPAENLVKTLKGLLPKNTGAEVNVSFDERTNRIILSGDPERRMMLRTLLAELDVPMASEGRVQVLYLRYAKAADLVPVLQKIASNQSLAKSVIVQENSGIAVPVAAPPVQADGDNGAATSQNTSVGTAPMTIKKTELKEQISIEADERMNALVISAPSAILVALKEVVRQLDIRRAQVLIEAIFVEISEDRAANLGVEWGVLGDQGAGVISFSGALPTLLGNIGNPAAQAGALASGVNFIGGSYNGNSGWGALLQALQSDSASNILATPSLLTLDNEEAEILVGREVPFQTGSYTTSTANSVSNPFSTIERKNVGLRLNVKPQINEGDEIYLEIDQEVSDVLPKGEAVDIQTTKRQIRTRVIVGDGNVVVLGGLINEKETQVESKVPGLGDIPGLGALFRSSNNSREKVNLMVFLRPVIVRDNAKSDFYSRKKYQYLELEQQRLLDQPTSRLMQPGLRPQLPQYDGWREQGLPVTQPDKPAVSSAPLPAEKPSPSRESTPPSSSAENAFKSFEELIDGGL